MKNKPYPWGIIRLNFMDCKFKLGLLQGKIAGLVLLPAFIAVQDFVGRLIFYSQMLSTVIPKMVEHEQVYRLIILFDFSLGIFRVRHGVQSTQRGECFPRGGDKT